MNYTGVVGYPFFIIIPPDGADTAINSISVVGYSFH